MAIAGRHADHWRTVSDRGPQSRDDVLAVLQRSTLTAADDFIDQILPSRDRRQVIAGAVKPDGFRLRIRDQDRAPWWLLSPVLWGDVASTSEGGCTVAGTLIVRRSTLIGIAAFAAIWSLLSYSLVLSLVVGFAAEVLFALRTTRALTDVVTVVATGNG